MEQRTIVAIEIASSKIKGGVAAVDSRGNITILAVEEIPGINNVRYGRVQNIREVSAAVNEIIRRFEANPVIAPRTIDSVVLPIGGRSLAAIPAAASLRFPHECEITEDHVKRLKYEATRDFIGDKNVETCVPTMYYVNNSAVRRVVGTYGDTLRGEFMMITSSKEAYQSRGRIKFDNIDPDKLLYMVRQIAVANLVLTPDEREIGTVLVDFGAETTTVSVHKDGSLAFLSTLPMGSRLITLDLMAGLGITEEAAENFKLTLGNADAAAPMPAGNPHAEEVNAYVSARAAEIAANIDNQIERSGLSRESLQNIVLVGGGAKLPEFGTQLSNLTKMPVRVAAMPGNYSFRVGGRNTPENIDIVALLTYAALRSDIDCLSPIPQRQTPEVFVQDPEIPETVDDVPEIQTPEEPEEVATVVPERPSGPAVRRTRHDEEDDVLSDDPDDDDEPVPVKKKSGFSLFGFKRKEKRDNRYTEPEDYEEEEPDEEPYDDPRVIGGEIDPEPATGTGARNGGHNGRLTNATDDIKNRILKIFMPVEGDEDD